MNNLQAKQMLKQVDCHGIPRGYNGGYSELYKYCLDSIEKLEKIEQIVERFKNQYDHTSSLDLMVEIKEVLNG